jgi:hypothetical protein
MLPSAFHALSRNYPDLRVELDLAPPRGQTLAGASCGEDREFERPRRHARPAPQSGQETGNVIKGESGMMLDPPNSGARAGRIWARFPFHCAGFGPWRKPRTVAASSTASIRPRTRPAVSGFSVQIGSRTWTTSPVSIAATGNSPNIG